MSKINFLNNINLIDFAKNNQNKYQSEKPFPHIVLKNFFNPILLNDLLNEFPDLLNSSSIEFDSYHEKKLSSSSHELFGPSTKNFMNYLNSWPFLNFLQILTNIDDTLLGDPYFLGGGLHEIKTGGYLKIHTDFNKHTMTKLDRRINILIYLNKNWSQDFGGKLELWDKDMKNCIQSIAPEFNTTVIFNTTDYSYHGHPDPLSCPENNSRKSLALYYYSNGRPSNERRLKLKKNNTIFKQRSKNTPSIKSSIYRLLRNLYPKSN